MHASQGAVVSVCRGASGSRQGSLYLRLGRALRASRNAPLVGLQEDRSVDIDLAADARAVPLFERGATAPMLVADLEPYMVDGLEMTRDHVAARPPDLMREALNTINAINRNQGK